MNLVSVAEQVAAQAAAVERSTVAFDSAKCLHTRDKFSNCQACLPVCPVGAIQPRRPPVLEGDTCAACLACLPVCPTGAFSADDAVPALLNCAARIEAKTLELVCERHPKSELGLPDMDGAIRIRGCLAGLGVGGYLGLMALGLEKIVARADACAQCVWAVLQSQITSQLEQARRLLEPWGRSQALALITSGPSPEFVQRPVWQADNPPLSRRDLFRLASRRGQTMIARAVTQEEGTAPHRPARERQRVLNAVAHLPPWPEQAGELAAAGPGFANVSISEDCTACGVCARACPTGALQFPHEEAPRYQLTFTAPACIGCEMCAHVCAPGALSVEPEPSIQQVFGPQSSVLLRQGDLVRCERCRAWFAARPDVRLCPTCAFRKQNPFGSRTVPGLMKVRS